MTDTSPCAFPRGIDMDAGGYIRHYGNDGMSLRDYFAAKAMQALITTNDRITYTLAASDAYSYADAMLEARKNV